MQRGLVLKLLQSLVLFIAVTCVTLRAYAFEVPPLEGRVNDHAALLSPTVKQQLTQRLAAHEQSTGVQIAILTIDSLGGVPVEDFSIRVVETWKLGKKGKDDGVLLLVSKADHKMRIEVGYGLEGVLPDITAGRITRDIMAPQFRKGNYEAGIAEAVEAIIGKTGGTADNNVALSQDGSTSGEARDRVAGAPSAKSRPAGLFGLILSLVFGIVKLAFFGIFVVVFIVFALLGRGGGRRGGGFYVGGGGFGGGSGGGGSGGDSFGGGGGGFGGGGASGDW